MMLHSFAYYTKLKARKVGLLDHESRLHGISFLIYENDESTKTPIRKKHKKCNKSIKTGEIMSGTCLYDSEKRFAQVNVEPSFADCYR